MTSDYSQSKKVYASGLRCQIVQYYFYFPEVGSYDTFRPTITIDGKFAGIATGISTLKVVQNLTVVSKSTIQDIINTGSKDDILDYLQNKNIHNENLFKIDQI